VGAAEREEEDCDCGEEAEEDNEVVVVEVVVARAEPAVEAVKPDADVPCVVVAS
jgi:hypothetical protein